MKRVMIIIFLILAAAAFLQAAASSGKSDSSSMVGLDGSVFFAPGTDAKKVEDKIAQALISLDFWKKARLKEKGEPLGNFALNNSTAISPNIGINRTFDNSSALNSSLNSSTARVADAIEDGQNAGSSSKTSFSGYYGMTASRHEMGKSGINSRTFLSGTFEMDNTVKFQDQGFD